MELEYLNIAELRRKPINNRVRTNLLMEKESLDYLKSKAEQLNTTASEILRAIIKKFIESEGWGQEQTELKIFYKVIYGIDSIDEDGISNNVIKNELSFLTENINEARGSQLKFFDEMINMMRSHNINTRKKECAFCYIEPISKITNDNPFGENAFDRLNKEKKELVKSSKLVFYGKDF